MKPARVLVVDDAPLNRKLLVDLLAGTGYDVVAAESGQEALGLLADGSFDLVLLDVVMPGMTGYEVCRAIRENPTTRILPVVLITALEALEERVRGLESGADDFLSKPIRQPELLARVRSLLRVKELYRQVEDQAAQLARWNAELEQRVGTQVAELERLGALKRFLPPQVVERVLAGDAEDPLTSHRREIVVVCIELRGFTAFAETTAPEELLDVLQDHQRAIGQLVVEYEGTIERITGDGMVVFFNDPVPQPDAAQRAVAMALRMRERSEALALDWEKLGADLSLGFGITQGYATLGAIGLETRSDYSAIGIVSHLAARLCESAQAGEILMSRRVNLEVADRVESEPAGALQLRGFPRAVEAYRALRLRTQDAPVAPRRPTMRPESIRGNVFRLEGEYWTIAYDGTAFRLRDSKGLRHIAQLLAHPDRDRHVLDLVASAQSTPDAPATRDGGLPMAADRGDAGVILDSRAKAAYRDRLTELRADIAEAEGRGEVERATRARGEIDLLSRQLAQAVGLGGRDRRTGAAAERARVNVTRAISDGVRRIREHCPALARHLEASLRTGTFCTYRPPEPNSEPWLS